MRIPTSVVLRAAAVAAGVWLAAATCANIAAATLEWKPDKPIEIIAQSAAGGGTDLTARLIQRILQERQLVEPPVSVINKPGGGGNIGLAYLSQRTPDGHSLEVATALLLTNHILGSSNFHYTDFTLLALLNSEYVAFAVRAESPIKTVKDILAALKKDPSSLSIAVGTSLGGANHMSAALVTRAAGGDAKKLKLIVFKSSAESATALLGGHVDMVVSSASLLAPHFTSGAVRILAMTAPRRSEGLFAPVPTWKELGYDIVVDNFRALIGPSGMAPAQIAFWDDTLARLMKSDDWKTNAERMMWDSNYRDSRETRKYFDAQYEASRRVLSDLGMARK